MHASRIERSGVLSQLIPLSLTAIVLSVLIALLWGVLALLNRLPVHQRILLTIRPVDVAVGVTIYLKTSIDFAIFMGRLMASYPGWRNRIAIEVGSAVGNAVGTILVIGLWVLLKDIELLLAAMVFIASVVLVELAHASLEQVSEWEGAGGVKRGIFLLLHALLDPVHHLIRPFVSFILPNLGVNQSEAANWSWSRLLVFSSSVPFILGLDDFAGYVPLFSVVNVYGFAVGVLAGHTILNIALFLSPRRTIAAVKNAYVAFFGALAFIAIAIYGFWETGKIIRSILPLWKIAG